MDFCAIYQPTAVNSLVVTQSQESGGTKKKREQEHEERKKTKSSKDGITSAASSSSSRQDSVAQASVLDNGVRYIPPRVAGGACQNVAWICIIPNPDMLLLHRTTHGGRSYTHTISTELFILPSFWKVSPRLHVTLYC